MVTSEGNSGAYRRLATLTNTHACARAHTHSSVSPELVPLHPVAVVEGHRAAVGNGIKTKLLGMLRVPGTDVFSPAEGEYLLGQSRPSGRQVLGTVLPPALRHRLLCLQSGDCFKERTKLSWRKTASPSGDKDC